MERSLHKLAFPLLVVCLSISTILPAFSQDELSIKVEPENLVMNVGEKLKIKAYVVDKNGKRIKDRKIGYYSRKRRAVGVDSTGLVTAYAPGSYSLIIISPDEKKYLRSDYKVEVSYPPITKVEIQQVPNHIYAGTSIPLNIKVFDKMDMERKDVSVELSSANKTIANTDQFFNLHARKPGKTTITASVEGITGKLNVEIIENPVVRIELTSNAEGGRTGDVFHFTATALDKKGNKIEDAPITYTYHGVADDVSSSASGLVKDDGRFVADEAGRYTITASSGPFSASKMLQIAPRNVKRKLDLVGKGLVNDKHTSDFWIWEGVDGKDYGVTGTWGADGTAYFWDVTDPANIQKIDSIQVDARTVNDVKISEDGKICVISREGASNRKNGIVIIDVTNPRDTKIISTFTENLTGGVHNLFIYQNHVYALSAGQKYYIINIEDPKQPRIVSKFELDTPGHAIHDVWVEDGIAYSSNWSDGVYLVDVGNGIAGGSPENPVAFANYEYPSGAHHATFPFKSKSTGKFYTVLGDEIFPYGLNLNGPNVAGGFLHFVDFTDLENPEEIARFEVPGAGSHNYWIEDETLYVAFYNGGVRVVDISGELMGDLYKQGREIAWILPSAADGYIPNSPFTWGAQLYKGHIFYSDWNSGLWAAKLEPEKPENTKIQTK
ncbi:Ig-like domain-containing protein [Fulvivirgaceae bacterium BMA10]|uniref:Ig-like domain-containing protein n=1 Tax=Splendidivirga corallicola TaxID=3051826 RepID=A0ABT8KMU5_9BACT|nr:Ig-like domain-containing protein [Fulvivirgaceae bacterium BMA10]